MKSIKIYAIFAVAFLIFTQTALMSEVVTKEEATMRSTSSVDWTKTLFSSKISLDIQKANIQSFIYSK